MTADDVITRVTNAPSDAAALEFMQTVHSRALLLAVADQLYIDAIGHASAWVRKEIVKEARF